MYIIVGRCMVWLIILIEIWHFLFCKAICGWKRTWQPPFLWINHSIIVPLFFYLAFLIVVVWCMVWLILMTITVVFDIAPLHDAINHKSMTYFCTFSFGHCVVCSFSIGQIHIGQRKKKIYKTLHRNLTMEEHEPNYNPAVNSCALQGLAVPAPRVLEKKMYNE
jgi:hypothetical protein